MKNPADAKMPAEPSCTYCRLGAPDLCRCVKATTASASGEVVVPLSCKCGRPYSAGPDLVVPDDVWIKISPTGDEGGILCPNCIHDALVIAGFGDGSVRAAFTSGPMADASWRKEAALVTVPRKPTQSMIDAYFETCARHGFRAHINASTAWEAMISTAEQTRERA